MKYEARLEVLRLWSFEKRQNRADLTEVYKMMHGLSSVPITDFSRLRSTVVLVDIHISLMSNRYKTPLLFSSGTKTVAHQKQSLTRLSWSLLSECLQTASGQDLIQRTEFLHGLVVHITLLAAAQARVWQKQM